MPENMVASILENILVSDVIGFMFIVFWSETNMVRVLLFWKKVPAAEIMWTVYWLFK